MVTLNEKQKSLYDKLKEAIGEEEQGKVANLFKGVSKDDLRAVLTATEDQDGKTVPLLEYAIHTGNQEIIKAILDAIKDKGEILKDVLTTANITWSEDGEERTLTPLGYAICFNYQGESVKAILDAANDQGILKDVLTTANIHVKLQSGEEHTLTPLGYAIRSCSKEGIEAILSVAAKERDILEKVLTTADTTIKFPGGERRTVTPLGYAISLYSKERIGAILDAAKGQGILKELFAIIKEDERNKIKPILEKAKNETGDHTEKAKIDGWLKTLNQVEKGIHRNVEEEERLLSGSATQPPENTAKTTNKPIVIGSVCGAIAASAVIGICFAVDAALPILAIAGIAVAAALIIGLIAGYITCAVSEPNSKMKGTDTEGLYKRRDFSLAP